MLVDWVVVRAALVVLVAGLIAVLDVASEQEVPLAPSVLLLPAGSRLGLRLGLGLLAVGPSLSRRLAPLMLTIQGA